MSTSGYINVDIKNDQFTIVDQGQRVFKKNSALETLRCIQDVIRRGLDYSSEANDVYAALPKDQLYAKLKEKAVEIQTQYLDKTQKISCITRFFKKSIGMQEDSVKQICQKILTQQPESLLPSIPKTIAEQIMGFLNEKDVASVAKTNSGGRITTKSAVLRKAQHYGYKGQHLAEAKAYLHNLTTHIKTLAKNGHIPKNLIVYRSKNAFFKEIDTDATLEKVYKNKRVISGQANTLSYYIKRGQTDVVKCLLDLGVDPNTKIASSNMLHFAVLLGNEELVQLLLEYGTDPNCQDNDGTTPIFYHTGQASILERILKNGAEVNHVRPSDGSTYLHYAAQAGNIEAVRVLLNHGAKTTIKNANDHTPFMLVKDNHTSLKELLKNQEPAQKQTE